MGLKYNEVTGEFEEEKVLGLGDLVFDPVSGEFRYKSDAATASGKRSARKSTSNPSPDFKLSEDGKTLIDAKELVDAIVVIPDGVEVIKREAFYKNEFITDVFIPEGVRLIEFMAFAECPQLANVHLPKSLIEIESYSFAECYGLKELFLSKNVRKVGICLSYGNVIVDSCNKHLKSLNGAVLSKDGRVLYHVPKNIKDYTVPDGVEEIQHSFSGNRNLRTVVLPNSLRKISSAFRGCHSLSKIELPEGLQEIGNSAFEGCYSLKEIVIPESVTKIYDQIFDVSEIKKIVFKTEYPERIKWSRLLSLTTQWGRLKDDTVFYVPQNALEKYRKLTPFKKVTLVPIIGNINSFVAYDTKEQIRYKSKSDFCHIGDIVLGETTWADASRMGHKIEKYYSNNERYFYCGVGKFSDYDAIGLFDCFIWTKGLHEFPCGWEEIGMRSDMSYDAFMALFKSWGFSIDVHREPRVVSHSGRDTLNAKFVAVSSDRSIIFTFSFESGNIKGEGASTSSLDSLYSITVDVNA